MLHLHGGGYTNIAFLECVQKILDKAKRWEIVLHEYNIVELLNTCDDALYRASLFHNHCLYHLYPVKQESHCMTLPRCGHNLAYQCFAISRLRSLSLIDFYICMYNFVIFSF